jgi:hypothetical protein
LLIDYYTKKKQLPSTPTGNWKLVPEAAQKRLVAGGAAGGR